jgi:hypothetical protein
LTQPTEDLTPKRPDTLDELQSMSVEQRRQSLRV